jgi:hypothetical protein
MIVPPKGTSRRDFVTTVGKLASLTSLTPLAALAETASHSSEATADWDLSWVTTLVTATDRAVFDWPSLGDPADPQVLYFAERYLDNCATIYAGRAYEARVVLNIRTQAVPAALNDAMWERYALGVEYKVNDPATQKPATRNPFWHRAPDLPNGVVLPAIPDLLKRGAIALVCDFALTHLAERLAAKANRPAADVHQELRSGFIPAAYAVPSGIFGLAKAQNAGCAFMRL